MSTYTVLRSRCCAMSGFWRPANVPFARTPPTKRRRWQSHGDPDCIDERNGEARTVPRPVRKRRRGCWPKLFAGTTQSRAPPGDARKLFAQGRAWWIPTGVFAPPGHIIQRIDVLREVVPQNSITNSPESRPGILKSVIANPWE